LLKSSLSLQPQRVSPPSSAMVILLLLLSRLGCLTRWATFFY
jgi:hypothetical protein